MEEGSGLESLINQRLTRPSYTRMVSWEFSNQKEVNSVKRKRRRSKKQSNVDEEINFSVSSANEDESDVVIQSEKSPGAELCVSSSDDDCLYFSAEETLSSDSDSVSKINQGVTSLDIEEISGKDIASSEEGSLGVSQPPQEKKHAPSKKQKRKRRKSKNAYVLHAGEILSVMEIDIEPDVIGETQELVEESLACIEKAVPSLVELCLNCTRRRKLHVQLPRGLKNIVKHSNKEFTFRKLQVSWLQNEFSKWQPFEERKHELLYAIYDDDWGCNTVYKCLLPARNIWNNVFYPQYLPSHYNAEYSCSKTSSILPFTFVTNLCGWMDDYDCYRFVFHQRFLGCLATLVDLMMPTVLNERNVGIKNEYKSESEQILAATKIAMSRVKGALNVRFRDITDLFFDKIIPYVFWARGDFHQASTLFAKLTEGDKRSRFRAMCMIEIARMHAQLGETDLACRFYRMASDIALEKGKATKHDKEVFGQTLMLLASVYDQGMMTLSKDRKASDHWKYVVTSGTFNQGAANMAAISMLCFHSQPGSDTEPSSFVKARSRLEAMVQVCPKYLYHISMLQALAGQESDADNTYRSYIQRANADGNIDAPGLGMNSNMSSSSGSRRKRHNIWHNLSAMVTKSGPPQPLHVLWRSHLQPLRVCDPSSGIPPTEADLCCDNLDLRLNSQGYLTGNMKTMLPPMRSINLDPYTGKLCFPQIPGRTEPWTSLDRFYDNSDFGQNYEQFDYVHIPCPLEVYREEDGTTVQMMLLSSLKNSGATSRGSNKTQTVTLFWSNGKDQTAKRSVLKIFWQLVYDKMILKIKKNALQGKKSEQWQNDCLKVLKYCLDTKREIDYDWIHDTVEYSLSEERRKNPKTSVTKFLMLKKDVLPEAPELLLDKKYTSYGKTLALSFLFCRENISVFIDCSSREAFLQPEIRIESRWSQFPDIPNNKSHKLAGAEIFYLCGPYDHKKASLCVRICGQKGKVLDKTEMGDDGNGTRFPHVIGSSLLIVTLQSRLWCWNDGKIKVDETLPELQEILSTETSVVMVTLRDRDAVRFVDTPSLESVPVRATCDMMERLKITEDGLEIKAIKANLKVLTTHSRTENGHSFQEVVIGFDLNLVTLHILQDDKRSAEVVITEVLPIPGFPVEHHFIGRGGGYMVSWTQQDKMAKEYKENLFYFSDNSELLGVLPCLGRGPRSFFPLYLPGDSDTQKDYSGYGLPGWYVYMRDGHDGIIAVKLPTC